VTQDKNNVEKYTKEDEAKMDRVAEAGVEGAFGADPQGEQEREELREDAEQAFGGDQQSKSKS
jgi:hypothetical protein